MCVIVVHDLGPLYPRTIILTSTAPKEAGALGSVMKPSSDIEMWDVTSLIAPSYRISR
jgi:hypothetical protein